MLSALSGQACADTLRESLEPGSADALSASSGPGPADTLSASSGQECRHSRVSLGRGCIDALSASSGRGHRYSGRFADMPTGLEDVDETHEQRAQFLAVESVLLFTHFHFQLLGNDVL